MAAPPKKILLQLDTDADPSTFDGVVAVDAGVDQLFRHGGVTAKTVTPLVHGAMFTRGGDDLRGTAIFVGGGDVATAEQVFTAVTGCFFGPVRVSVMLDANGCNTTAAAAVLSAAKQLDLDGKTVGVLGGTGPVGRRVAEMSALRGASVLLASRDFSRAEQSVAAVRQRLGESPVTMAVEPIAVDGPAGLTEMLRRCDVVISCGAAGVELIDADSLASAPDSLRVAIDLNAVPPAGIAGIGVTDKAVQRGSRIDYGAIGVGGLKMKIHRQALKELFDSNDRLLDAAEILEIGQAIVSG